MFCRSCVYTEECLINCYFSLGISDFFGQCLSEVIVTLATNSTEQWICLVVVFFYQDVGDLT